MCGITAIVDVVAERPPDERLLRSMNASIAHRGPDGEGFHFAPGVGLGHRRLAIIDLAGGRQPLYNEDGSVVVSFNGEIYNFPDLEKVLAQRGHTFRTRCDTEVIVHAWEEWGERCVEHFNGMFAFALWDARQKTLFAARDRLGEKPLYYAQTPEGWLYLASELKALLQVSSIDRALDEQAIEEYFAFGYVPDPRSILKSVRKLPPAHYLTIARGSAPRLRRYWDVSFGDPENLHNTNLESNLLRRLQAAIECRLISDVPLGAFLSGGVDSSAVVALMAGISKEPVKTCSISFGDPQFNESQYAARVAARFGTEHHVEQVDTDDFDLLDTLVSVYDEPFADSSAIPTYRVCELARRHVTVALSGDGGDEVFAGYRRYRWHVYEEKVRSALPYWFRRPVFGTLGRLYPKLAWAPRYLRAKSTLQSLGRDSLAGYFDSVSILGAEFRKRLFSRDFQATLGPYSAIEVLRSHADSAPRRDPLSLVQYIDLKTYLPGDILVKVDRASMAHSLEVRVPLLDHTFVDWASRLQPGLKLHDREGKYMLKKALERILPNDILYREKMGFAVPIASWFRGALADRLEYLVSDSSLRQSDLFDIGFISQFVRQHQAGRWDHSATLWALLMFDGVLRKVIAR